MIEVVSLFVKLGGSERGYVPSNKVIWYLASGLEGFRQIGSCFVKTA